jgi:Methyltransferase domain
MKKHETPNRTRIINRLITNRNYSSYLEIGYGKGRNFQAIRCDMKVSVDPNVPRATFPITSDEFFAATGAQFDLVFIDGLHHADQVMRDIENALIHLNTNGLIVAHDLNPRTEVMQTIPQTQSCWTGDCWRAWLNFRSKYAMYAYVIDSDFGVGVINPARQAKTMTFPLFPSYTELADNRTCWLNLQSAEQWWSSIGIVERTP